MIMLTELVSMKRVMRRLELADINDVPTLKAKLQYLSRCAMRY